MWMSVTSPTHYMTLLFSRCEWVWQVPLTTWLCCCLDVNECDKSHPLHHCDQRCINKVPGFVNVQPGYMCDCNPGYRLETDGKNCTGLSSLRLNCITIMDLTVNDNDYLLSWSILFLGTLNIPCYHTFLERLIRYSINQETGSSPIPKLCLGP